MTAVVAAGSGCSGSDLVEVDESTTSTVAVADGPGLDDAALAGLRTTRSAARDPGDLGERMRASDPEATDVAAGAAGYDAVVLAALAAEVARSDAPGQIAASLADVSRQGEACTTFTRCRRLAEELTDLDYDGRSGGIQLLDNGDPGEATFQVAEVTRSGSRRVVDTTTVQAPALTTRPPTADRLYGPGPDGALRVGTLLPVTGPAAVAGRSALAGVRLAVADIDGDRGVLGAPVELVADESGDGSVEATKAAVQRLIDQGVDVVVGGATEAIDAVAIGPLTDAGILMISPTDRNRFLSALPDRGLFHRVVPSEELEVQVLGRLVGDDGSVRVAIVLADSDEGENRANDLNASLNSVGAEVTALAVVGAETDVAGAVDRVVGADAQAVVVLTPPEISGPVLRELVRRGQGPATVPTYALSSSVDDAVVAFVGDG